jgi:4-hydroxy-tetrahydrodipicolinate synthase
MHPNERFQGLFIPLVTPFDDKGRLDAESLERLARYQTGIDGVAGLSACARIGEGPVQSVEEKKEVYRIVGTATRAAGKLHIATIFPQSTDEALRIIDDLAGLPVDAVMVAAPLLLAWGKVHDELKYRFWEDLNDGSKLPLVLFQVPVVNYQYNADLVCRIAKLDKVIAYKEASFNKALFEETCRKLKAQNSNMQVLTGNDRFVGESYRMGGVGSLIGISNVATPRWGQLDIAGRAGKFDKAVALQAELEEISNLVFSEPIVEAVARIKIILRHEGLIRSAHVRRPQLGVSNEEQKRLIESYQRLVSARAAAE